jgi:nitrite reductase (NADH) small subunit
MSSGASRNPARHKQRHVICTRDELAPGTVRIETIAGAQIGVFNVAGSLYAIRNVCPHALGPICLGEVSGTLLPSAVGTFEYGMENRVLRCPWHRFEFDLDTGKSLSNWRGALRMYDVSIEGEDVALYV